MAQSDDMQSLAEAGERRNWVLVKELLCNEDVDAAEIERSFLLHKVASDTKISFSLVKDIVDKICSRHVDLLLTDDNGHTAVMAAARCNNWEAVSLLCRKAALPEDTESVIAILQTVARSEDLKKSYKLSHSVLDCLWNGIQQRKPDCQQTDTHSVLSQVGAKLNCWWLVRYLLSTDLDLNLLDEDGLGVIHRLAMGHKDQHVSLLLKVLDKGADINLRNVVGDTAVHIAAKNSNWRMVETLLKQGASADIPNNQKQTLLHILAVSVPNDKQIRENFDTIFTLLQKVPVNIDATDGRGNTALHSAVKERKVFVVEKLMDIGARADVVDDNGGTVLHTVGSQKFLNYSPSLVTRLIERGGDLETRNAEGNTAVQEADKVNNWIYIKNLKDHGAVASLPTSEGHTCFEATLPYSHYFNLNDPNDQLHSAVEAGHWNTVKDLVEKGANINKTDSMGFTVIQKLAQRQHDNEADNIFGFMVNRRANVHVWTPSGDNLMHLAAKHNNWPIVKRLVKLRFNVYEPDSEGLCVVHRLAQDNTIHRTFIFSLLHKTGVHSSTLVHSPGSDSLLQTAAKHSNISMVEYLVQQADLKIINQLDSEGFNILHRLLQYQPKYLAYHKEDSVLNIVLRMGANPKIRTSSGDTALHLAAKHNKWNVIERLVEHGCDVNEPDNEGFFVIHRLAQTNDLCYKPLKSPEDALDNILQLLLHKQADLSVRCPAGNTALHLAAKHGKWKMVKRLVEQGCSLHEPDSDGLHIIHRLVDDNVSFVTYFCIFLEKGTDLSVLTPTGDSVLHLAARHNDWNLVELLIEQGCDMSTPDSEGFYILHRLGQRPRNEMQFLSSTSNDASSYALFLKLVDKGASPLACSRNGDSVLHVAAKHRKWTLVSHLLALGVNTNDLDSEGFCILHRLVTDRFIKDVISQLITKGADINCKCSKIGTALHIALKECNWNLAKLLTELGADVRECDYYGMSVLHIIAKQELPYGQSQCIPLIKFLIEKGADIKARCPKGDSFLHLAAKRDNWEIVEQMISHTACKDEDVNEKDNEGFSILHRAASRDRSMVNSSLLHVLLNKGAKCDIPCPSGESALHLAVKHGNWWMIDDLLRCKKKESQLNCTEQKQRLNQLKKGNQTVESVTGSGCESFNIDTKDGSGNTVLHLCAKQRKWDQVHQLLMSGADPMLTDDEGHTVMYRLAAENHHTLVGDHNRFQVLQHLKWRIMRTGEMDEFGDTLIQIAARNRNFDFVPIWLHLLNNVDVTDLDGLTLLHRVAQCTSPESLQIVRILWKENADTEVRCPKGNTALHFAAQSSNWDVVEELLRKGAKAGDTDSEGMSVLHRLVRRANFLYQFRTITKRVKTELSGPRLVKLLATQGVDVNKKDPNNLTPLQLAVIERECEWEMVQTLVECGADVDLNAANRKSLFHKLAKDSRVDGKVAESVTKRLLSRGLDLNERDSAGDTPLNLAAKHKNWRVARIFVKFTADVSIPDSEGWFVCHRLAMDMNCFGRYGDTNMSDFLSLITSNGFEVNKKGPDGENSLQIALKHSNWEVVRWLVQFGASYELSLDEKKTVLQNVLQLVGSNTDREKMKSFILHVIDKGSCASSEMGREMASCEGKALQQTILQSDWDFAKTLVEWGIDINTNISDEPLLYFFVSKYSPRYHTGWLSLLDFLLARGVDINCRDKEGRTVLFRNWGRFSRSTGCGTDSTGSLIHVLIERGADPALGDAEGISLLREAVELKNCCAIAAVTYLIELGVSTYQPGFTDATSRKGRPFDHPSCVETSERSPTQRAFEKNNVVAFKMLVESGASSNKELYELNTGYQGQLASKDNKSTEELEMLEILRDATSEPRSLKSLCRLTVSHAVGCGPHRKEKVMTLPVPAPLQDYILFCDVLSASVTLLKENVDVMNLKPRPIPITLEDGSSYLPPPYHHCNSDREDDCYSYDSEEDYYDEFYSYL